MLGKSPPPSAGLEIEQAILSFLLRAPRRNDGIMGVYAARLAVA